MTSKHHGLIPLVLACACTPAPPDETSPPPLVDARVEAGYPGVIGPCAAPVPEPTHLVVTTTDFNTGAVSLVDVEGLEVEADLALASSDAVPVVIGERVFVINRFGFDYVDELDPRDGLALIHEWPIDAVGVDAPANPHDLALDPEGAAWVSLHGAPELQRFGFPTLQGAAVRADLALDLSGFADADAIPELSLTIACGDHLFVSAERIDRGSWIPVESTVLIPVLADDEPALFEFDPGHAGPDALELRGVGVGPWRLDPSDPSGTTILLLGSGLERVDLQAGTTEWVVEEATFAGLGYGRLQLSGFDLDASGRPWISVASEDFAEFALLRVDLDGPSPTLTTAFEGLVSVSGGLEIVGDRAWFADSSLGASGMRIFELGVSPVVEVAISPLPVGLAPIGLAPLALP